MLRMMAGRRMPSITDLTIRLPPKWRRDMTLENLTSGRDNSTRHCPAVGSGYRQRLEQAAL
jgi:hypothetical protein